MDVPPRRAALRAEPPRVRLDVDERRRQLVKLGIELFSERTYDEVSIDELAQEAGISKGLLYHYFPTKRHFYVETVREAARQLLERTATAEGMEPLERLRAGLDAYVDYVSKHGKPYHALLRSGVGADAEVTKIVDETRDAFCARLVEARAGRDAGAARRHRAAGLGGLRRVGDARVARSEAQGRPRRAAEHADEGAGRRGDGGVGGEPRGQG